MDTRQWLFLLLGLILKSFVYVNSIVLTVSDAKILYAISEQAESWSKLGATLPNVHSLFKAFLTKEVDFGFYEPDVSFLKFMPEHILWIQARSWVFKEGIEDKSLEKPQNLQIFSNFIYGNLKSTISIPLTKALLLAVTQ